MRTLVHLSDLHFGHEDEATLAPLASLVASLGPDAVVVSGDLTQRARRGEFRKARAFLDTLPGPQIIVPGNHDVPLFDVARRFLDPLGRYRRFVSADVEPFFADSEVAIVGLNTARSLTWKSGRLNAEQVEVARGRLASLPASTVKVVVTHHPFDVPPGEDRGNLVRRAPQAMAVLATTGADLFLSGHLHLSHTGRTAERYRIAGHSALVINAGTSTSTRQRGEVNTFNELRLEGAWLRLRRFAWEPRERDFRVWTEERYSKTEEGWGKAMRQTADA